MVDHARWTVALVVSAATTIGCDRLTKHAAALVLPGTPARSYLADTVRLEFVENAGGFLSLGADLPPIARTAFFTTITGLLILGLAIFAFRTRRAGWSTLGLVLFLTGGASNWIDRVVRGCVVDFLNVGIGPLRTGVFNVADVAIMGGAALFVIADFRAKRHTRTS
jgi:signal peptidase II